MRYQSNLVAPDLRPFFKLANPMIQKLGHDCPSDPDFDPECTFLTHDEAAILYHCAKAWPKRWVDIGARFGWSTAHLAAAKPHRLTAVDPELKMEGPFRRFEQNMGAQWAYLSHVEARTSEQFFAMQHQIDGQIDAAMIDGNHDEPAPTADAFMAIRAGAQVLVWHDFAGKPIRDAVAMVLKIGPDMWEFPIGTGLWKARVYWTPNLMAVAWREGCGFVAPDHVRDPRVDWSGMERIVAEDFDVRRCC